MPASARAAPLSAPSADESRGWDVALGVLVFVATLVVYAPALRAGFIWNDIDYVTAPALRSGHGLARIWFEVGATEQYYPLLHSAFWLQHRLWGDQPAGYHLVNVLLHAACAVGLASALRRLDFPRVARWLAAFLFALHPVCVESVAWISEQKNTLSLFFYLLAARAYLQFDRARGARGYAVATLAFLAALLTKTVTATLPAALLVIFWWRRGRLRVREDVAPLLPWFVLGAAMGLFSAWVERHHIGAEGADFALTFVERALLAGRVAWFYLGKLLWPAELVFIYPRWTIDAASPAQWLFPLAALALLAGLWATRHRSRGPLAAVLFFGGSLVPTSGFFNVYAFLFSYVADHWQYLPSLGLVVLGAAGAARLWQPEYPRAWRALPVAALLALALVSRDQATTYADLRTFYASTLARNPGAWMAQNNLGNLLRERGDPVAARVHLEAALRLRPDLAKAHHNLAAVLRELRQTEGVEEHYRRALALQPDYVEAHNSLGSFLRERRRAADALPHLLRAVQLEPENADARNNLGMTLRDLGRAAEAIVEFQRAVRLQPAMAAAHLNLALSYSLSGREDDATRHYREARRLNPAIPELAP